MPSKADGIRYGADEFEVSIFLTETSTRHSMLYKHKHFRDTSQTKLTSNSSKLTGASRDAPVDVDQATAAESEIDTSPVPLLREEDDDDVLALQDIPAMNQIETAAARPPARTSKHRRGRDTAVAGSDEQDKAGSPRISDEDDNLFVSQDENEDEDEDEDEDAVPRPAKRRKHDASAAEHETERDDKKKLAMDISYEGFSIYGRVLCLVVKRRGGGAGAGDKGKGVAAAAGGGERGGSRAAQASGAPRGQAMMENWITSTQMPEAVANGLLEPA